MLCSSSNNSSDGLRTMSNHPFSSRTIVVNAALLAGVLLLLLFARRDRAASLRPEPARKVADAAANRAAAEAEQALADTEEKLVSARKEQIGRAHV